MCNAAHTNRQQTVEGPSLDFCQSRKIHAAYEDKHRRLDCYGKHLRHHLARKKIVSDAVGIRPSVQIDQGHLAAVVHASERTDNDTNGAGDGKASSNEVAPRQGDLLSRRIEAFEGQIQISMQDEKLRKAHECELKGTRNGEASKKLLMLSDVVVNFLALST